MLFVQASARAQHLGLSRTLHFPGQRPSSSGDSSPGSISIYCDDSWRCSKEPPVATRLQVRCQHIVAESSRRYDGDMKPPRSSITRCDGDMKPPRSFIARCDGDMKPPWSSITKCDGDTKPSGSYCRSCVSDGLARSRGWSIRDRPAARTRNPSSSGFGQ